MEDLPIHSLLKSTARDPGETRSVRRGGERGFDRELHRAASTTAAAPTGKPQPAPSQTSADDESADATLGESSSQRHEQDDDGTTEVPPPAVAPQDAASPATEAIEQPHDTIELTVAAVDPTQTLAETEIESDNLGESTPATIAPTLEMLAVVEGHPVPQTNVLDQESIIQADPGIEIIGEAQLPPDTAHPDAQLTSAASPSPETFPNTAPVAVALPSGKRAVEGEKKVAASEEQDLRFQEAVSLPSTQAETAVPAAHAEVSGKAEPDKKPSQSRAATPPPATEIGKLAQSPQQPPLSLRVDAAVLSQAATIESAPRVEPASSELPTADTPSSETAAPRDVENPGLLQRPAASRVALGLRSESSSTDMESRVDAARFVGRVAGAFRVAQDRGGVLQLRLSPPELGSIKLELLVESGSLTARIEAETPSARKVLLDNLPALRERLAQQDIRVERFDVDVRRDGAGGQPDWQAGERQEQRSPHATRRHISREGASSMVGPTHAPKTAAITDGRLNVIA
ncbi:MAG: flagellar hook-length control protein FliK [Pirellulales bacterium]